MSNPAVITLENSSNSRGKLKRFVIEDNIGEAIHLHIDNIRIDFTIDEFLDFSQMIKESFLKLGIFGEYNIENFDAQFLKECGNYLSELEDIKIEEISLSKLRCIVRSNYKWHPNLLKIRSIENTPVYKYLKGEKEDFINYYQHNYRNTNNEKRLLKNMNSIKKNKYPYNDEYIVIFDGQNYIRDGQHRAAILAHLYGLDSKIKVMVFYFRGKRHHIKIFNRNTKTIIKWAVKKSYRTLKKKLKNYIQR
jgi:hypothetical protein